MKKIYILIITIVLLFISFLITLYIPKNYEISYKLDQYEINEKYSKEKKQYTFLVKYEDIEYPFLINHKYTKKQKLIKDINKADKCLSINALDNNYELCTENNKFIINNISDANNKKDLKSLTVLNEFDEKIYAWNYKGYTQIFHNNTETINILNNDNYENKIAIKTKKYLLTANYDDKYEINKLIIINTNNNKQKDLNLDTSISQNSYFLGEYKEKLYLVDKKNKYEYEINPKNNKIKIFNKDNQGYIYDEGWINISMNKLVNEKYAFTISNPYNFQLSEDKLTMKINHQIIQISNKKISSIVEINEDTIYFISDDTLYKYTYGKNIIPLIKNTEWKFNYNNQLFIFN